MSTHVVRVLELWQNAATWHKVAAERCDVAQGGEEPLARGGAVSAVKEPAPKLEQRAGYSRDHELRWTLAGLSALPCAQLRAMGMRHVATTIGTENPVRYPRPAGCTCPREKEGL
jgi:hypothetical protein